jgi:branched-chain amino acid transport system ATP-binding protein
MSEKKVVSTSTDSAVLRLMNVTVSFGGLKALQGVTFDVPRGGVFGIIGPNGAGKSTLLDVISRLRKPSTDSQIVFDGVDLLRRQPHNLLLSGITRTFQGLELSSKSSVLENVMVGATATNPSGLVWDFLGDFGNRGYRQKITTEALTHLSSLGIDSWANSMAGDVPYAVQKRVQVCRALMADPKLLLLDEPASGMGPSEKLLLQKSIRDIHSKTGVTIIIIEHDVGFLTSMCTRMLALNFGKVLTVGSVSEVTNSPDVILAYLGTED